MENSQAYLPFPFKKNQHAETSTKNTTAPFSTSQDPQHQKTTNTAPLIARFNGQSKHFNKPPVATFYQAIKPTIKNVYFLQKKYFNAARQGLNRKHVLQSAASLCNMPLFFKCGDG